MPKINVTANETGNVNVIVDVAVNVDVQMNEM